jgi:hypothetical protein
MLGKLKLVVNLLDNRKLGVSLEWSMELTFMEPSDQDTVLSLTLTTPPACFQAVLDLLLLEDILRHNSLLILGLERLLEGTGNLPKLEALTDPIWKARTVHIRISWKLEASIRHVSNQLMRLSECSRILGEQEVSQNQTVLG